MTAALAMKENVVDGVRCRAKGRGDQKNEGLYFEYRTVDQPQRIDPEEEKADFSWVRRARGSVKQYKQAATSAASRRTQQEKSQSQQRQHYQAAEHSNSGTHDTAQPTDAEAATSSADASASGTVIDLEQLKQPASSAPPVHPADAADAGTSIKPSSQTDAYQKRKQQMLQRMKGANTAGTAPTGVGPAAAAAAAAAAKDVADPAAAAAPATSAGPAVQQDADNFSVSDGASNSVLDLSALTMPAGLSEALEEFKLDDEAEELLEELIDMAQQLSASGAFGGSQNNDPLADPLDALFADAPEVEAVSSNRSSTMYDNSSSSSTTPTFDTTTANGGEGDDVAELILALEEARKQVQAAETAVKEDDRASAAAASQIVRVADLIALDEQLSAEQQGVDMEADVAAMQRGEFLQPLAGEVLSEDEEAEYEDQEADQDADDGDLSWLENDPEIRSLLEADEAAFARLLASVDADGGGSSSVDDQEGQQDEWAGMNLQDWMQAAVVEQGSNAGATAAGGSADAAYAAAVEGGVDAGAGLSDLLDAIDDDPSLDRQAKLQARMGIQGMFNEPGALAGTKPSAGRSDRRSKFSSKTAPSGEGASSSSSSSRGMTTTSKEVAAAGQAGQDEAVPELKMRPRRPTSS